MPGIFRSSVLAAGLVSAALVASGAPGQAQETIRASIQSPAGSLLSEGFDHLLNEIETATEGRVTFEPYYSGSLAKPNEQLRATSTGLAGIALVVPTYVPGDLPLANVGGNPALWSDSWVGSKAYQTLYDERPELHAELEDHNVALVAAYVTPTYFPMARDTDLTSLDQLEGMRVMTSGQLAVLLEQLGARIVNIPTPEGYEALQRGTIDGAVYGLTSATTYGIEDVVQSVWQLPLGGLPLLVVMNKDIWDSLSEEDQQAIREVGAKQAEAFHEIYQIGGDDESLKTIEEAGVTVIPADEASLAGLQEEARKIWDAWAEEQEAAGRPGRQIMDRFVELTTQFAEQNPYAN